MTFEWGTGQYNYRYREDLFNEQSDDIHLSIFNVPPATYVTKLWASVAGGIAPDLFYSMTGRHKTFLSRDAFISLNDFISGPNGVDLSDFNQTLLREQLTMDGQVYALPQAVDCLALYYNKDLFAKAGIPPLSETEPITWDQYRDIAIKLTLDYNNDGHIDQYGCVPGFDNIQPTYFFYVFHASYGGQAYNDEGTMALFDRSASVEAYEYLHSLIYEHKCAPTPAIGAQVGTQLFPANRLGMFINGPWVAYDYEQTAPDLKYGVAPLPYRPGHPRVNYAGGPAVGISRQSENPEAAWEVIKFLVSPEFQKLPIQGLPSRSSVVESPDFDAFPYWQVYRRELENGITNFFIEQYDEATTIIDRHSRIILSDPNSRPRIPEILSEMNQQLNALLQDG